MENLYNYIHQHLKYYVFMKVPFFVVILRYIVML